GGGAGGGRRRLNGGGRDRRILRDAQLRERDRPDQRDQDRHDRGEDRAVHEERDERRRTRARGFVGIGGSRGRGQAAPRRRGWGASPPGPDLPQLWSSSHPESRWSAIPPASSARLRPSN